MTKHTGRHYQSGRDTKDIAADIRKELKLRRVKASVRIERFSLGSAIHVLVRPERYEGWSEHQILTDVERVLEVVKSFQHVDSDMMTDYYNTNFYDHVGVGNADGRMEHHNMRCSYNMGRTELAKRFKVIWNVNVKPDADNVQAVNFGGR